MEKSASNHFLLANKEWVSSLCTPRDHEKKIGQNIELCQELSLSSLKKIKAKYVLLGAAEDIGARANLGRAGADSAFLPSINRFLNMQSNDYLSGKELILLGQFDFSDLMKESNKLNVRSGDYYEKLRELTGKIDEIITPVIQMIVEAGKIPILVGGGHNNSYPLLKGLSKASHSAVNCINLDPHADFREMEGRHSGNGFSYAQAEGYLEKYSIVGIHESYNSQKMLNKLAEAGAYLASYEDIFLRKKWGFKQVIQTALQKVKDKAFGLELDLDSIENIASSAETPCGISTKNARFYVSFTAQNKNCSYLHIAEGAPSLKKDHEDSVGKLIAYLICDFIKSNRSN